MRRPTPAESSIPSHIPRHPPILANLETSANHDSHGPWANLPRRLVSRLPGCQKFTANFKFPELLLGSKRAHKAFLYNFLTRIPV